MASVTTNYGFDVPTSSDLVKNGATQIALLGQDIDTFLFRPFTRNVIINGGYDNWQRGTSFTAGAVYSADRWYLNAVSGTTTVSRDTDVPTGLAGQYSIKQLTAAGSSFAQWSTPLETATVVPLQGKAVVLSYYMKKNATWSNNFGPNVYYSNSTDALASQTTAVTIVNVVEPLPTTSWTRFYTTFTVPSDAKGLLIQFNPSVVQASGASLNMAGVQLEVGSQPTPFTRAGQTVQGELAACQRYYYDSRDGSNQPFSGYSNSTDYLLANVRYPVTMRTAPSVSIGQSSGLNFVRRISTNAQVAITVTSYPGTNVGGFSAIYAAAAPFVAAVGYDFYILASAEL
jgi:hypothetical protein